MKQSVIQMSIILECMLPDTERDAINEELADLIWDYLNETPRIPAETSFVIAGEGGSIN